LYATLAGNQPLKIECTGPATLAPDVSATLSANGEVATLFAVNPTLQDIHRTLDLSAFGKQAQYIAVWTLADEAKEGEPDATNSFAYERVRPIRSDFHAPPGARFDYRFPALSLTVLQWRP